MSMRKGTIVRFWDGRVAVKKVTDVWEVSGTTRERYRDSELDEGYAVVYTPPKDVSGYGLGTIVRIGEEPYMKVSWNSWEGGTWQGLYGNLGDSAVADSDFIELYVVGE